MDVKRVTVLVSGRVQGVGYRAFARRTALDMRLSGYAENLPDGRVEVIAEGPKSELEAYLLQLKRGPLHAEVADLSVTWSDGSDLKGFYAY